MEKKNIINNETFKFLELRREMDGFMQEGIMVL